MEKEYGKLAQSDIEALFLLLPVLEKERQGFQGLIEQQPQKFAERFLSSGFAWANLYEEPFLQLLGGFLVVSGLDNIFLAASKQEDPVKAVLDIPDDTVDLEWAGGSGGQHKPGDLLGYLHAIAGNLECLLIYGSYLN